MDDKLTLGELLGMRRHEPQQDSIKTDFADPEEAFPEYLVDHVPVYSADGRTMNVEVSEKAGTVTVKLTELEGSLVGCPGISLGKQITADVKRLNHFRDYAYVAIEAAEQIREQYLTAHGKEMKPAPLMELILARILSGLDTV